MKRFKITSAVPNFISCLRIVGTVSLLFLTPLTTAFYIIYTLSGLSDVLDGAVARATNTTSELGSRLDSIADLLFYAVMIFRVFPALWKALAVWVWYIVLGAVALRLISYIYAATRYRRFSAMHTYGNKVTGLLVFLVPYFLLLPSATPACAAVAVVALLSSGEELLIHLVSKEYDPSHKSIFLLKRASANTNGAA